MDVINILPPERGLAILLDHVVARLGTGALLGVQGITKNRGRWFAYQTGTREIRAMPMLHPAYLLRSPIAKRQAWRDMIAIKKALG